MFTKGNTTYSEAFGYLRRKNLNMVTLQTKESPDNYVDDTFSLPLKVEIEGKLIKIGGLFLVKVRNFSYATVKVAVIKMRYSNDDQMAIILNRDQSPEDAILYDRMQQWRQFASEVARAATAHP